MTVWIFLNKVTLKIKISWTKPKNLAMSTRSIEDKPLLYGTHLQQSVEPVLDLPKPQGGSK